MSHLHTKNDVNIDIILTFVYRPLSLDNINDVYQYTPAFYVTFAYRSLSLGTKKNNVDFDVILHFR
jgi:hypothetical protein